MNRIAALLMAAALFVSAACQRKILLDPHNHYNVIINAHFDSLAQTQLKSLKSTYAKVGQPASTKYILYERSTQKVASSGSFKGLSGGLYVREEGLYDLLVYTSDFHEYDANFFRGLDNWRGAETYTRQSAIKNEASQRTDVTEVYMVEPDPTFAVVREEIAILGGNEEQEIDVEFVQKSFKYYLTIRAKGLHNIHTATMHISGMYTTAYLTNEEHRMDEAGTQTVDLEIRLTDFDDPLGNGELYGEFWAFGPNQREDISNSITLHFINGDVIVMKLKDLTSQIKTLTRGGEIIVEEYLEIKGPAGGFQPSVGDWDDPTDVEILL